MEVLNRLPAEIWEIILMDLDKSSLLATTLTCKDFYNFIYGSSEVMNNYRLIVRSYTEQKNFINSFGSSFRTFDLRCGSSVLWIQSKYRNLFETLRNVSELCVSTIFLDHRNYFKLKMDLPLLKSLTLKNIACSSRISYLFRDIKIAELKLDLSVYLPNAFDDDFVAWIHGQNKLTTMDLDSNAFFIFFTRIDVSKITFKLKTLKINIQRYDSQKIQYKENFSEFMQRQDEIEGIHLKIQKTTLAETIDGIFASLFVAKNLKKFKLFNASNFGRLNIDTNNKIEHFVNDSHRHYDLVEYFPNLKCYEDEKESVSSKPHLLSINCLGLQILKMKNTSSWTLQIFRSDFTNLKEIHFLRCFQSSGFWKKIVDNSSAVEKLVLHHFSLNNAILTYMATNWKNFRELHLGCGSYERNLFSALQFNKNFQKLVISKSTFEQCTFEDPNYRIYFYENGREKWKHWDESVLYSLSSLGSLNNLNDFKDYAKMNR